VRVLLTGGSGQLGAAVRRAFADGEVVAPSHRALDIADPRAVRRAAATWRPDVVINCAAFNDVDGAEDRPAEALASNAFGVRSLARAAEASGAVLVHFGTDFVFDGTAREPYREDDEPSPQSTYGASKLLGDWFALDAPRAYVLRVESLFGTPRGWPGRRGTLERIVDGLVAGDEVTVFTDRIVSPSYVYDVALATRHLVGTGAPAGLYHCTNAGAATWEAIAREAARRLGIEPRLRLTTSDAAGLRAGRPQYAALDSGKLAAAGWAMRGWPQALGHWLASRGTDAAPRP
jgi:dTDP-4-dehydrorhamnose reductase